MVGQRVQKCRLAAGRDFVERGGLGQLRRDGADQLVRPDAFTDGDFKLLADGLADRQRDFDRWFRHGREVEVAFIN